MGKNRVLLVDNDPYSCSYYQASLNAHGYSVRSVESSSLNLRETESFKPDIAVVTRTLRDMDATETCRMMRDRNIPILFLCDQKWEGGCDLCVNCVAYGLLKPVSAVALIGRIDYLLSAPPQT